MDRTDMKLCRWHAVANAQALQQIAIETILASAARAILERGQFHIVLAGGNCTANTDWSAWHSISATSVACRHSILPASGDARAIRRE